MFAFLQRYFQYSLIKYDVDQDEPFRNSAGFCIRAAPGALKRRDKEKRITINRFLINFLESTVKNDIFSCLDYLKTLMETFRLPRPQMLAELSFSDGDDHFCPSLR